MAASSAEQPRTATVLLAKFLGASAEPLPQVLEESKEISAWLTKRLAELDAQAWRRMPAAVTSWVHTTWNTASASTIGCLHNAIWVLEAYLVHPLVQDLAVLATSTALLEALHQHLARTVGKIIADLLPRLVVSDQELMYTFSSATAGPDGDVTTSVPLEVLSAVETAKAKKAVYDRAQDILRLLGLVGQKQ